MGLGQLWPNILNLIMVVESYIYSVVPSVMSQCRTCPAVVIDEPIVRYGVVGNWCSDIYFIILSGTLNTPKHGYRADGMYQATVFEYTYCLYL